MKLRTVNFNIRVEAWHLLNKIALKTGRSRSAIISDALIMFFRSMEENNG